MANWMQKFLNRYWGESAEQIAENMRTGQKPDGMGWVEWCDTSRKGIFTGECHWYDPPELRVTGFCNGALDHDHTPRWIKVWWRGPAKVFVPLYWMWQWRGFRWDGDGS